jgi:hypothetical protein
MDWTFTQDVEEFVAVAGAFLSLRPAENTIELGAADAVRRRGRAAFGGSAPLFGWWRHAGGPVESTFLHTPPYPGLLTSGAHEDSVRPRIAGWPYSAGGRDGPGWPGIHASFAPSPRLRRCDHRRCEPGGARWGRHGSCPVHGSG